MLFSETGDEKKLENFFRKIEKKSNIIGIKT